MVSPAGSGVTAVQIRQLLRERQDGERVRVLCRTSWRRWFPSRGPGFLSLFHAFRLYPAGGVRAVSGDGISTWGRGDLSRNVVFVGVSGYHDVAVFHRDHQGMSAYVGFSGFWRRCWLSSHRRSSQFTLNVLTWNSFLVVEMMGSCIGTQNVFGF